MIENEEAFDEDKVNKVSSINLKIFGISLEIITSITILLTAISLQYNQIPRFAFNKQLFKVSTANFDSDACDSQVIFGRYPVGDLYYEAELMLSPRFSSDDYRMLMSSLWRDLSRPFIKTCMELDDGVWKGSSYELIDWQGLIFTVAPVDILFSSESYGCGAVRVENNFNYTFVSASYFYWDGMEPAINNDIFYSLLVDFRSKIELSTILCEKKILINSDYIESNQYLIDYVLIILSVVSMSFILIINFIKIFGAVRLYNYGGVVI